MCREEHRPFGTPARCAVVCRRSCVRTWWAFFALLVFVQSGFAATTNLTVEMGANLRMSVKAPIQRVAIGNPEIVDAKVIDRKELLLVGKAAGQTTLIVWSEGISEALQYIVTVSPPISRLESEYKKNPAYSHIRVSYANKSVILNGSVATAEDQRRAVELAKSFFETITDDLQVDQEQTVSVEVRFAAISVTTLKALGFDFRFLGGGFQLATTGPNSVSSFNFAPGSGLSVASGLPISEAFNLLVAGPKSDFVGLLSALSRTSLAQILAEPTLVVKSGESAEFLAGGEIPIPVPEAQGAIGIEYRRYGIQLRVSATVLSPKRIALKIAPEVSDLDFSHAISISGTEVPAIATRSANTTVDMADGKSFILAGLMSSTQSNNEQRIPFLGNLPILGPFFKRVENTRERQELIIVVTPHLVNPTESTDLASPPGNEVRNYDPTLGSLVLGSESLDSKLAVHGLMP